MDAMSMSFFVSGLFAILVSSGLAFLVTTERVNDNAIIRITTVCFMLLGAILLLNEFWGAWYSFFKNAALAVPTWAWVVAGITLYFTLNHIYAAWLQYAEQHPNSIAAKIIGPWPLDIMSTKSEKSDYFFGAVIFIICWLVAIISYAVWIIFGGGIAKLLHLLPRKPRP